MQKAELGLGAIVILYLIFGVAYAARTPIWQAPDEPAHFNYIKHLAEGKGLPVLRAGDYDFDYLERIKAAKFPPEMSVDSLRYEFHQPPLYYALVTPLYLAVKSLSLTQQVFLLRFFSVLLGSILLITAYALVKVAFPQERFLAYAVPAFIATLPQHSAMAAAINNDTLAEVLLSLILLISVKLLQRPSAASNSLWAGALGVLLGLSFLTKTTAYIAALLIPIALLLASGKVNLKRVLHQFLLIFLIALVFSGWWFLRNTLVYGDLDLLGLKRHDQVVLGQPTPEVFDLAAAKYFVITSFKSFWAQFGWMGVPADERAYILLAALSAVAGLGFLLYLLRVISNQAPSMRHQALSLVLLILTFLFTLMGMLQYNFRYIQPQGRYLFPALLPIGVFFGLGLGEIFSSRTLPVILVLVFTGLTLLNLFALVGLIPQLAA